MRYQAALFALKVIKIVYMLIYDVVFQYFLIPLGIWNGIQGLFAKVALC